MTDSESKRRVASEDTKDANDVFLRAVARAPEKTPQRGLELVGAKIAHFRVGAKLGAGGMGIVYRAEDERLGRSVALKMLLARENDENARRRFLREARAASVVEHPCVATIYEVGEADEGTYIAMELVRGQTMLAWLRRGQSMDDRMRVVRDVARALAKAHAMGIVHRDLKPENVMIAEDGRVKVLDFGLAKAVREEHPDDPKTVEGALVGTPGYMSPEQAKGLAVDARSDVFSFGVLLYETFTGTLPFAGETAMALVIAADRDDPEAPRARAAEITPALEEVILRCLAKRADQRFADGGALVAALEGLEARAVHVAREAIAPSPEPKQQAVKASRTLRNVGIAIAIAALGVALPFALRVRPSPAPPAASIDASPRGKAITDFEPYGSTNAAALDAYRRGLRAQRTVTGDPCAPFQEAVSLDPAFAEAQLRAAICLAAFMGETASGRASFREATMRRDVLHERDRGLLEAWEPTLARQPSDQAETYARSRALSDRFADDAELAMYAALAHSEGDIEGALPLYRRELALDPGSVHAVFDLGESEAYLGHAEEARGFIDRCIRESPASFICLWHRIDDQAMRGACADVERDARRAVAVAPELPLARMTLAGALVDAGQIEAARALVEQTYAGNDDLDGEFHRIALDSVTGDFASALRRLRELAPRVARETSEKVHARLAAALVVTHRAMGREADAVQVARDFLAQRGAWESDPRADDWAIEADVTSDMLGVLRRAGAMSTADANAARAARVAAWRARGRSPLMLGFVWLAQYASAARTPEEAREALAALPALGAVPPYAPHFPADAHVGRTLWLAGRVDEAIPILERASRACDAMAFPVHHHESLRFLGEAREAKGDTAGACEAYGALIARWPAPKPRSADVDHARIRRRSLRCP